MRTASPQAPTPDDPEEPLTELQFVCRAADLLQQMFTGLQWLATENPSLAYTMFDGESDAYLRLQSLLETIHELLGVDDLSVAIPLRRRAASLIWWLSDEIDRLMLCAANGSPMRTDDPVIH
jgi:hypothetical protein